MIENLSKVNVALGIMQNRLSGMKNISNQHIVHSIMAGINNGRDVKNCQARTVFIAEGARPKTSVMTEHFGVYKPFDLTVNAAAIAACECEILSQCGDIAMELVGTQIGDDTYLVNRIFKGDLREKFLLTVNKDMTVFNHFESYYRWLIGDFLADVASNQPMESGFIEVILQILVKLYKPIHFCIFYTKDLFTRSS